ncbi:helix-turn-helix domain-containing protein [Paractinoplanes toevensis]|nr:helix-turn-helix transcriptional regulator [Actinoplanes toevensis]
MLQGRRLRSVLRRLREGAKLTQEYVATKLDWSKSKVLRIENGQNSVSTTDLKALLDLYGVKDLAEIDRLVGLGRESRKPGWTDKFRDGFVDEFRKFLEYEGGAAVIRQFEAMIVPGPLQTESYATATIGVWGRGAAEQVIARRVEMRLERQRLLWDGDTPQMLFVLDEAVLRRQVGNRTGARQLMTEQLHQLRLLGARPSVSIRVLPFDVGEHAGMPVGSFTILEFDSPEDEDLLYLESPSGDQIVEAHPDGLARYHEVFDELLELSLSSGQTADLLDRLIAEVSDAADSGCERSPP